MTEAAGSYCRVERLPWRKLEGQTVIVDPRTRQVHVLNGTGALIWDLLGRRRSLAELVQELERDGEFEADREAIRQDVASFLEKLQSKQLLEPGP
jgi:Coenzyme PQQ synthesis protein D (PqqD)